MIHEPCKIEDTNKKTFSFRPINFVNNLISSNKARQFVKDNTRIDNYLQSKNEEFDIFLEKDRKNGSYPKIGKYYNHTIQNNDNEKHLNENEKHLNENKITYSYLQPVMKYAPRTQFERIYDTLNSYDYGRIDKTLITDQLKSLGFLKVKNKKYMASQNEYSLLKEKFKVSQPTLDYLIKEKERLEKEAKTPEIVDLINNIGDIIKINKEIIHDQELLNTPAFQKNNQKKLNVTKKKIINNFLAKNILGEYQKKTHFKALLNCTLNLDKTNKNYKSLSSMNKTNKLYNNTYYNDMETNINDLDDVKKICLKPFHNKRKYPKEDLEYLKKICSSTQNEYFRQRNIKTGKSKLDEDEEANKYLKAENTVVINGIRYNKKDVSKISKIILKECNYIKKYFQNEKTGSGKTMITHGLSVNEFTEKYGLPK